MDYNGSSTFNIFPKHIYSVALHRLPQNLIYLMDNCWISHQTFFLLLWQVMLKSMLSWPQKHFPQCPIHTHLLSLDFVMIYEEMDSYFHLHRFKCIILSNLCTYPVCFQKTSIQNDNNNSNFCIVFWALAWCSFVRPHLPSWVARSCQ